MTTFYILVKNTGKYMLCNHVIVKVCLCSVFRQASTESDSDQVELGLVVWLLLTLFFINQSKYGSHGLMVF